MCTERPLSSTTRSNGAAHFGPRRSSAAFHYRYRYPWIFPDLGKIKRTFAQSAIGPPQDGLGARTTFHMIHMVGMNVPEHRGATQLALAALGDPHDDRDEVRRQPESARLRGGQLWKTNRSRDQTFFFSRKNLLN